MKLSQPQQDTLKELKGTAWTYKEVAEEVGIDADKFDHLMKNRFDTPDNEKEGKDFHLNYTMEWAERVKNSNPFRAADEQTEAVMEEAGYTKRDEHQANRMF